MSQYHFFPFLRQGLAGKIQTEDQLGSTPTYNERASINAKVVVQATDAVTGNVSPRDINQSIKIKGPGDITGINSNMIIKACPRDWVTNMEPFYLPYIEFYDEDFPWRYTPAKFNHTTDDRYRLRPWIALVVLKENEFTQLPFNGLLDVIELTTTAGSVLPDSHQLWAWAHVHVNARLEDMAGSTNITNIQNTLRDVLKSDPDKGISRILCPRRLEPNTGYHAFLVPAFETGRLAGLNDPTSTAAIANTDAQKAAWETGSPAGLRLPVYYKWFFKTGSEKGFEALVRLLKPKAIPNTVGKRKVDLQFPGDVDLDMKTPVPTIGLPGILQPPTATPDPWTEGNFTAGLKTILNRPADFKAAAIAGPDPIISPPIYGQWHAKIDKLTGGINTDWLHSANLEPRWRMFAGAGAEVVRKNQDKYMQIAWQQVGEIIEANKKLRHLQLAMEASAIMYTKHFTALSNETLLAVSGPVHAKVKFTPNSISVYKEIDDSRVPNDMFSGAFRRLTRPEGSLMKTLQLAGGATDYDSLVIDVNNNNVSVAQAYNPPAAMIPYNIWSPAQLTPAYTLSIPSQSNFTISLAASSYPPAVFGPPSTSTAAFVNATVAVHQLISSMPGYSFTPGNTLPIATVVSEIKGQTNPDVAVMDYATRQVKLYDPGSTVAIAPVDLYPVMVAPKILLPMYKELAGLTADWMMPGLNTIEQNSINALKMSQANIEAFMLGLNHEMSRELLWRGYPTDQRGTYFQFFWGFENLMISIDPNSNLDGYKDIWPIHQWRPANPPANPVPPPPNLRPTTGALSSLGDNSMRKIDNPDMLILVIRGELLRKYPGTLIYMREAVYQYSDPPNSQPQLNKSRIPVGNPIHPIFYAKLDPDIYFLGFDITPTMARGTDNNVNDPGYFFVFEERAGELSFGADEIVGDWEDYPTSVADDDWNNLSWGHILKNGSTNFINVELTPEIGIGNNPVKWGRNSANMAHILMQLPVRLNVHAKELIPVP